MHWETNGDIAPDANTTFMPAFQNQDEKKMQKILKTYLRSGKCMIYGVS